MEEILSAEEKKRKYWIRGGVRCVHRYTPGIVMVVDRVVKRSTGDRVWVVGVDCHWLGSGGEYRQGRFMTTELSPVEDGEVN